MGKKLTTEEFIDKARRVHGDKYNYSKVEYVNKRSKVCIICPEHGEFWQIAADHINGHGCSLCSIKKTTLKNTFTTEEFIERARKVHNDKYDYSKVEYRNANTKVCIICLEHGEFWQMPSTHLNGCGCLKCAKIKTNENRKTTQIQFINQAKKVHSNKYDYTKVIYKSNKEKVCIICPEHGGFWQNAGSHLRGVGCPKCAGKIKLNAIEFIKRARKIHGEKYDYSKVEYKGNKLKVCIICPEHGEFWQRPNSHLKGQGCPKCSKNFKKNTEIFIKNCTSIHGKDKYDYSKVNYINSETEVCIICPEHGEFWVTPYRFLKNKYGCSKCKEDLYVSPLRLSFDDFLKKAEKIHNNKYDYSNVKYVNNRTNIRIICPIHGEFSQKPDCHLRGNGCPSCAKRLSNNENEIFNIIKNNLKIGNVEQRNRIILNGKELDIYIPDYNLAIEYNGLMWHSEKYGRINKNYHLDKLNECNQKNIRLIQIFEDEYLEHKDIVLSKIKHILGKDTDLSKVQARKCKVNEIDKETALLFLEKNHIQGFTTSTIYLGCFQDNILVGVMTFKEERKGNNRWELNRFATDINYRCIGIGGKLFKYFIKTYNPLYIKSFADRRWTLDKDNNLYIRLGFKLGDVLKPEYKYFLQKEYGFKRVHKFNFRKQILLKKYPDKSLTKDMTEKEMCDKIGAYRIWDCGLFKFEWFNKN